MSAHKGGALTTATNPPYDMTKQGGGGGGGGGEGEEEEEGEEDERSPLTHEYELVGVSPGPPIAKATDKTYYEIPSLSLSPPYYCL